MVQVFNLFCAIAGHAVGYVVALLVTIALGLWACC